MCSRIDTQARDVPHPGPSPSRKKHLTRRLEFSLTFDLLTSGSVHAEVVPRTMSTDFGADSSSRIPFLLERRQTDKQTLLNVLSHAGGYTAVGNTIKLGPG